MPWFYVDDGFADSKPVVNMPDRYRLAACGLWVLAGAWSAKEMTDGRVPLAKLRELRARPPIIEALATGPAPLWHPVEPGDREIVFKNWSEWQPTRDDILAKREKWAGTKKRQRGRYRAPSSSANREMSIEDTAEDIAIVSTEDSSPPIPIPNPISTYVPEESSPNVGTSEHEFGVERGLSDPVPISASRMVARLIKAPHPAAVQTALRIKASELITSGVAPDVVEAALRLWLDKPTAGPGLLPALASEVIKSRASPTRAGLSAGDDKVAGWLDLANPQPPQPPPPRGEITR